MINTYAFIIIIITVNNKSLAWLKTLANLVNLPSLVHPKLNLADTLHELCQTLSCQIEFYAVSPNFNHTKCLLFLVYNIAKNFKRLNF